MASLSILSRSIIIITVTLSFWASPRCFGQGAASDQLEVLHEAAQAAEAGGDLETAAEKYREIVRIAPRLAPAYNNLGAVYFKSKRYQDAVDTLERGLKIDPGMSSAEALLGMSFYNMGAYEKARKPLERALKANPADAHIELELVNTLTKLDDFAAAANHLQRLVSAQPNNPQYWYLLGRVYMQLSGQALAKVNEVAPDSPWAHEIAGELDENLKNYDGAILEYKKAEEVAPRQPGVHYKLGDLYWSLAQWDNATREFEQEKLIDPGNCMVDWKLGDILLQKSQNLDEGLTYVEKALNGCPNLAEAHADRGRLLLKLHREADALPELAAAERANPSEPSNHFLLAQAYRATGQTEQASAEMKLFAELEQKARAATAAQAQEVIKNNQTAH